MRTIINTATVQVVEYDGEFYCYVNDRLLRVCPSEGMAREVVAGY